MSNCFEKVKVMLSRHERTLAGTDLDEQRLWMRTISEDLLTSRNWSRGECYKLLLWTRFPALLLIYVNLFSTLLTFDFIFLKRADIRLQFY